MTAIDTTPRHLPSLQGSMKSIDMCPIDEEVRSAKFLSENGGKMAWCEECSSFHKIPTTIEEHSSSGCKAPFVDPDSNLTPPSMEDVMKCCKELRDALVATNSVVRDMGGVSAFGASALTMYDKLFPKKRSTSREGLGDSK